MQIIGNLGKPPELKYTQAGKPVLTFSIAVNNRQRPDAPEAAPTWIRVTAWSQLAETLANLHLSTGERIFVTGDGLRASAYRQQDGNPGATLECTARQVIALGHVQHEQADGIPASDSMGEIPF